MDPSARNVRVTLFHGRSVLTSVIIHAMWIKNTNQATRRLCEGWMADEVEDLVEDLPGDEPGVVFEGAIQIVEVVGEQLCDRHEAVERHETTSDSDSESDDE